MAAPVGNKFWELRSKHGRDTLFATPELMWQAACEYFEWCQANPLIELEQSKIPRKPVKDDKGNPVFPPNLIELPKMRAFTMQGLCLYLDCNTVYFNKFEKSIEGKEDELSKGFSQIITRIRETIFNQKFTGAAAGFLKENIIARELGLADKKDIDANVAIEQITGMEIL